MRFPVCIVRSTARLRPNQQEPFLDERLTDSFYAAGWVSEKHWIAEPAFPRMALRTYSTDWLPSAFLAIHSPGTDLSLPRLTDGRLRVRRGYLGLRAVNRN